MPKYLTCQLSTMTRNNYLARAHAVAGFLATALVASFFVGSLVSELVGQLSWIVLVKRSIFYSMWAMVLLVPLAALTGGRLAGKSQAPLVKAKRKRIRFLAPNGMLLLGLASYLYYKALRAELDAYFLVAQTLEFAAGLFNLFLLSLMIRDGFRLKKKYPKRSSPPVTN